MINKRKYPDRWIIGMKSYSNNIDDKYLDIVLAYLPTNQINGLDCYSYATWIYNHNDDAFYEGQYYKHMNKAIPNFLLRGSLEVCFNDDWIKKHDAIECHYVQLVDDIDSDSIIMGQCEAEQAQLVSVYLHNSEGGIECVSDHLDGKDAMRIVRYISNKFDMPIMYQPEDVHYIKLQPIIK